MGFGKPQRARRTQRKITTLCALPSAMLTHSASSVVNILCGFFVSAKHILLFIAYLSGQLIFDSFDNHCFTGLIEGCIKIGDYSYVVYSRAFVIPNLNPTQVGTPTNPERIYNIIAT